MQKTGTTAGRRHVGPIAVVLAAVGCGSLPPVVGVNKEPSLWGPRFETTAVGGRLELNTEGKNAADSLIAETRKIIVSEEFADHLVEYLGHHDFHVAPLSSVVDGRTLLAAYRGVDSRYKLLPTWVVVGREDKVQAGLTGTCGDGTFAQIKLGPVVLRRWAPSAVSENQLPAQDMRKEMLRKSCAINTMAHELTHTIIEESGRQVFRDRGGPGLVAWFEDFVSYGVGSIAQCTYLEREGQMGGWSFEQCVEQFGTSSFKSLSCGDPNGEPGRFNLLDCSGQNGTKPDAECNDDCVHSKAPPPTR